MTWARGTLLPELLDHYVAENNPVRAVDEYIHVANPIIGANIIVETLREQRALLAVLTFDKMFHFIPVPVRYWRNVYRSISVYTTTNFYKQRSAMSLQRNVQQQNELTFDNMLARARLFRALGVPVGARNFLTTQGIDVDTSVIVQASESYMLGFPFGLGGMLLTADYRFFTFELELNAALTDVVFVHEFIDVTSQQNMFMTSKGTGKGFGALAVTVLRAVNAT